MLHRFFKKQEKIYMDYAAATPLLKEVVASMQPFWREDFYNPSAQYSKGQKIQELLLESRASIAKQLSVSQNEIIFTNGGTEANNLALRGIVNSYNSTVSHQQSPPRIIISTIEHSSIRNAARAMADKGSVELIEVSVNDKGVIEPSKLKTYLTVNTIFISIIFASNEIGVIQPIRDICKTVRHFKKHVRGDSKSMFPLVHTDAIQAFNYMPLRIPKLGVDLLTLSAAKIYGPKGIAVLYKNKNVPMSPLVYGGGQEYGLRSGTENMPLIVGLKKAVECAARDREVERRRLSDLQDLIFTHIPAINQTLQEQFELEEPPITINGSIEHRLPNNINISVQGISSEQLVIEMDARGILCSSQSACSKEDEDDSYVVKAIRNEVDSEYGSLRITLGRFSTQQEVRRVLTELSNALKKLFTTKFRFNLL